MNALTIVFSCLLAATVGMVGLSAKGMVIAVARKGGKIRGATSIAFGLTAIFIGFLLSLVSFSIVVPSFGATAMVLSVLVLCLVSVAVQVKIGLVRNPRVAAVAVVAPATATDDAMAAMARVEPTIAATPDVVAKPDAVVPAVVPAAAASAVAVSSTAAPELVATSDEADELDAWADEQVEAVVAPAKPVTKPVAPVVSPSATLATANLTKVAAPVVAAPQLDLVDTAELAEQYEEFDRTAHLFPDASDAIHQDIMDSVAHEHRELQAA